MTQRSRRAAAVLAAAGALAACSTPTAAPEAPATARAQADDRVAATETVTGSRILRKSTDRNVRKTGAAGAAELERDRPPNPGGLNNN